MTKPLLLPRLGETMEQGRVVAWLKKPGDSFVRGEVIVEIETDKTVVELPALDDGVLVRIDAEEGTDVDVGAPLGAFDPIGGEADTSAAEAPAPSAAAPSAPKAAAPAPALAPAPAAQREPGAALRATPNARRLARQGGIDLSTLAGSGRRGRIQGEDVEAALGGTGARAAAAAPAVAALYRTLPAGRMAYREWGANAAGDPIVLLHGYAGDSQAWAVLASALQRAGRRVIAPDLPSHGATGFDLADPARMAEAVVAFVADLKLDAIDLVGHSLGGVVAVKAAGALGARVRRLTLVAPAGLGSEIDADFIDGMAGVTHGGGLPHLLRRVAQALPPLSAQQLDDMARQIAERGALAPLARRLVNQGRQQVDIGADLAPLQARTRIVWGLDDQIIPWHHGARAGAGIAVHFIPHAGHMPQWDQPQKLAALIA